MLVCWVTATDFMRTFNRFTRNRHLAGKSWKDIAELVGIAAIVASLVFVGLQMRQSHEIALSEAHQQRAAMTSEAFLALSENDHALAALLVAGPSNTSDVPDGVEPEEYLAFQYWLMGMLVTTENAHFQYQAGFLSEESWLRSRNGLKRQLRINNALTLPALQVAKGHMSQSFFEEVERIEAEVAAK